MYSSDNESKDAYSLTVSTVDQQGNKKEKTWIIGEDVYRGDIAIYGDVKATIADVTARKLTISGIPSDFGVELRLKSSGKKVDYADGAQSIPAGETIIFSAYRKGDVSDKKVLKFTNTADNSTLGYIAPEYGDYRETRVDFKMPDSDVTFKASTADTAPGLG